MSEQVAAKETAKQSSHDLDIETSGAAPTSVASGHSAILRLQQQAGNRAVTRLLLKVGARKSPAQRAPAGEPAAGGDQAAQTSLEAVRALVKSTVVSYRNAFKTVPSGEADALIQVISVYVDTFPKHVFEVAQIKDLVDLLAPWGFTGAHYERLDKKSAPFLNSGAASESLVEALKKWKAEDPRARAKSRQRVPKIMGTVMHSPTAEDIEIEEATLREEVLETGEVYTGPQSAMRNERKAAHTAVVMSKVGAVQKQGPGGFVGMATGYGIGLMTGRDPMWSAEAGQAFGTAFGDPVIGTASQKGPMQAPQGVQRPALRDGSHVTSAPPREPIPTPGTPMGGPSGGPRNRTVPGVPVGPPRPSLGSARDTSLGTPVGPERGPQVAASGPGSRPQTTPGMGALGGGTARAASSSRVPPGDVAPVRPDDVRAAFRKDPHSVFHSASDEWHQLQWRDQLVIAGQWRKEMDANPPPAPLAFRMKGGGIQVNDLQWKNGGFKVSEINRPSQMVTKRSDPLGSAKTAVPGGTQLGVPPGPQGPSGASAPRTQVGVPPGPGRTMQGAGSGTHGADDILAGYPLRLPQRPRLNTVPKDEIVPATRAEVIRLFQDDPRSVVVSGGQQFHEYVWRLQRWEDGLPTNVPAPVAFRTRNGGIRVYGDRWVAEGGKVEEILEPWTAPTVEPTPFEAAPTLPAGPSGPGATNVSIAPGSGKAPR